VKKENENLLGLLGFHLRVFFPGGFLLGVFFNGVFILRAFISQGIHLMGIHPMGLSYLGGLIFRAIRLRESGGFFPEGLSPGRSR